MTGKASKKGQNERGKEGRREERRGEEGRRDGRKERGKEKRVLKEKSRIETLTLPCPVGWKYK